MLTANGTRVTPVLLAALALGCQQEILAPGACPEFCPGTDIEMVDSILPGAVRTDSAFTGYVRPWEAGTLHLVRDPGGAGITSRGVVRFIAFAERLPVRQGDTVTAPVTGIDSFRLTVTVSRRLRTATGLALAVHRLPATVDTTATFGGLAPFFADSTRLATRDLEDTLTVGTVTVVLPATAFPGFADDGRVAAVGIALEGNDPGFVDLGTVESNAAAQLTRFARIDSAGASAARSDTRDPVVDLFVGTGVPPAGPTDLVIGGAPSWRTFLRFDIPGTILDSTQVVRGTLILVPTGPAVGTPGDTVVILAHSLPSDFGAKSFFNPIPVEQVPLRSARVPVGAGDTLRLDLTTIFAEWQQNPDMPRVVVLRAVPEGGSFAEARYAPTESATGPALRLTYVPPLRVGGL